MPILLGLVAGSITAIISVIGIARLLGATQKSLITLAPKSVTTPVAMAMEACLLISAETTFWNVAATSCSDGGWASWRDTNVSSNVHVGFVVCYSSTIVLTF